MKLQDNKCVAWIRSRGSDGEVTRYKARLVIVFKKKGKKAQIDRGTEETLATRLVELRLC